MDILEVLQSDHEKVIDMINRLMTLAESPGLENQWPAAYHDLKATVISHDRAEEAIFYEALRRALADQGQTQEHFDRRDQEHREIEDLLHDLEEANPNDEKWLSKMALIKSHLVSHTQEEEAGVFEMARKSLPEGALADMAHEFKELRREIIRAIPFAQNPAVSGLDQTTAPH